MKIQKYLPSSRESIFHSTGFARAANGARLGSSSYESFNRRSRIDRNRTSVARYEHSIIGRAEGEASTSQNLKNKGGMYDRQPAKITMPTRKFTEPSAPHYNPYK